MTSNHLFNRKPAPRERREFACRALRFRSINEASLRVGFCSMLSNMSRWRSHAMLVGLLGLLTPGCRPCMSFQNGPETICVGSDVAIREVEPFVLTAIVPAENSQDVTCSVGVDVGVITLTVSGMQCPSDRLFPGAAKEVVTKVAVACEVPPLDAGQYRVLGLIDDETLNVGSDAGTGMLACP